jgi:hypothetical protein
LVKELNGIVTWDQAAVAVTVAYIEFFPGTQPSLLVTSWTWKTWPPTTP